MMKRIVLLGILFVATQLRAQVANELTLFVCYDKTVNIIFPYPIVSEDHGSGGIIAQQRKGAAHILHVKANQKNFNPTSLSVVTSDGSLYSFLVRYADDVYWLNYVVDRSDAVVVTGVPHNERVLEEECAAVAVAEHNVRRKVSNDVSILRLHGLYISPNALWLKTIFTNRTMVPFPVGFIKFFIRDKRRAKNTAVQEREIFPVYQDAPEVLEGNATELLVFAFDPFVLNRRQQLVMQVGELNGNRFIQMRTRPKHFRRAGSLH